VEREGKWYCRTHDPEAVMAKDQARREKWDKERAADDAIQTEGAALIKRLGTGLVYYNTLRKPMGVDRAIIVPFEALDALLREAGR